MRHTPCSVLVGAMAVLVSASFSPPVTAASKTTEARTSIVVRTYTLPDSARDILTARRTAGAILERAGIEVGWLECGLSEEAAQASEACQQPRQSNEVVVRILSAGTADRRPHVDSLGFAFVDLNAGGGWLATVYADRVEVMARGAGVDRAELLGRTMAHELGHLLLGTNRHASHGLMRASWSSADLRRNRATQWLFGGHEGELMRRGVARRVTFRAG